MLLKNTNKIKLPFLKPYDKQVNRRKILSFNFSFFGCNILILSLLYLRIYTVALILVIKNRIRNNLIPFQNR